MVEKMLLAVPSTRLSCFITQIMHAEPGSCNELVPVVAAYFTSSCKWTSSFQLQFSVRHVNTSSRYCVRSCLRRIESFLCVSSVSIEPLQLLRQWWLHRSSFHRYHGPLPSRNRYVIEEDFLHCVEDKLGCCQWSAADRSFTEGCQRT